MGEFTWKEMSEVVHAIKDERVVICGAIMRMKKTDDALKRIEGKLMDLVNQHKDKDE